MTSIERKRFSWSHLGISRKIGVSFSVLIFLMLLIGMTSYCSFFYINRAQDDIRLSTTIGQQVLSMDRGTEKARRLLDDFFIHYQTIGLQKAHEQYAQPSVREIARVIATGNKLKENISNPLFSGSSSISQVDISVYLSSAKRFADISIEFVQLVTRRSSPERGVDSRLAASFKELQKVFQGIHPLQHQWLTMDLFYKSYLLHRQRPLMQSALNTIGEMETLVLQEDALSPETKKRVSGLFENCRVLAAELLSLDRKLSGISNDFVLQEQTVMPISEKLIRATGQEVVLAQERIEDVYRVSRLVILSISFVGILAMLFVVSLLNSSITKKIRKISALAVDFDKGNWGKRVEVEGGDELGELAMIVNTTASNLEHLLENMEKKVEVRTAALAESESRFRNLVSELPTIAVQGYDSKRRVVYWNKASENLYGYTAEEAEGRALEELIIPESMKKATITAIHEWFANGVEVPAGELTLHARDGSDVRVYSNYVMTSTGQGERTMYSIDQDLSDLRLAQAMERINASFYRQLFDHSSNGVAVYEAVDDGEDFIFTDMNRAGLMMDMVRREDVVGKKVTEVFPGVEEFGLLRLMRQVWKTGKPAQHPVSFYQDNKLQGWRENKIYKLPSGEVVAVYDDMTSEKQLEEEKNIVEAQLLRAQKMEAIGLMAGGVAHDLNNILTGITGYPELLLMQLPDDSGLRRPIEAIKKSGERAAAVVADLLTVARGVASTRVSTCVNTLVREYLDSPEYQKLADRYPFVRLSMLLAGELPNISCSPIHIKKCLMNLVTNGTEAIEKKGQITVSTTVVLPDTQLALEKGLEEIEYVMLSVTDTGTGIPPENIDHIFEPFYTKKVMGLSGTGLGLAVVWNTVEDHDGKIIVESSDKGTCFQLYFPVNNDDEPYISDTVEEVAPQSGNGESILIVDDEEILRDVAAQMLTGLGYKVASVSSGEEAIEYVRNTPVDLLLLDMLMEPGISGLQTYDAILLLNPRQKAVVVSGFSESVDVKKTLKLGASSFVKKPYSLDQLAKAVLGAFNG